MFKNKVCEGYEYEVGLSFIIVFVGFEFWFTNGMYGIMQFMINAQKII